MKDDRYSNLKRPFRLPHLQLGQLLQHSDQVSANLLKAFFSFLCASISYEESFF